MHPAKQYIDDVLTGKVIVCRFVKLAVQRHVRDLETGSKRGLWFDEAAAEHAIDFFKFLRHSKGEWAGQELVLSPWQQFVHWCVFGWKRADGTRRFREVYEEVARKNGKSTKLSGTGLYLFFGDDEPGAEVYTAATKKDQARITHSEATRMVKASPALARRIRIFRDNMHVEASGSKFEPLASDADTTDGLNIHGAILDELHAHKTRDMVDVIDTATGARRQPLIWYITTAGYNQLSICWEKRNYARKILTGIVEDDSFFGIIFTLDRKTDWPELRAEGQAKKGEDDDSVQEDSWRDRKVWIKANPNLGISVKLDDLERKAQRAEETPAAQNAFLCKHLSIWTQQETRWMPMHRWDLCQLPVVSAELRGMECYGGLDLSSTTDIAALVLVFPVLRMLTEIPETEQGNELVKSVVDYKVLPFFWIPKDSMKERVDRDKVPYDVWVRQGYMTATDGDVIDYSVIKSRIKELCALYNIREIAYDRWGATKLVQDLQELKLTTLVPFGQGFGSMSGPTKELLTLVLAKPPRIHHAGNPVLRWMADNVVVATDPAENIKPNKAKSVMRIDGIVGTIMGLDRAMRNGEGNGGKSIYEKRGAIVL